VRAAIKHAAAGLLTLLALVMLGWILPGWCIFLLVTAFAKGLTALGLVVLLRSGLLSFGQGLFYCAGGYGAGLLALWTGIHDVTLLVAAGGMLGLLLGLMVGPLLARYRGIFFATLTLALSMLFYGILAKTDALGGTDGLNFPAPSFFGYLPRSSEQSVRMLYVYTSVLVVLIGVGCRIHFNSVRGLLSVAARDNEIRVEYLGMSVNRIVIENIVVSGLLGGIGGALNAIAIAHIDPELAFWTTSGELTFVAVLGGPFSVPAAFVSSTLIEFTRSMSSLYFPNAWQMSLGLFMLVSILFLPAGIGSLFRKFGRLSGREGRA
jgi:ABC-type branched-subunit amino acid transport system permease subunit